MKKITTNQLVFFIQKSQQDLQKAHIKIVAHAIYIYLFFSYTCKVKSSFDQCFPQQIRPQITVQLYTLQDYSNMRIGFNMINKHRTLPIIHHVSLNLLCFKRYSFAYSFKQSMFKFTLQLN